MKYFKKFLIIVSLFNFCFLFFIFKVEAAKIYLESREDKYYQGDIFIVEMKLDTEEEKVNALKVVLGFPFDKLEILDIDKGNSALFLWPEEPSYSNETGIISFIGGTPGGFSGEAKVVSIPFRVIYKPESDDFIEINFQENSQLLLNDGLGTKAEAIFERLVVQISSENPELLRDEWQEKLEKDSFAPEPFNVILKRDPLIFDGKYFISFFTIDIGTGVAYYKVKEGNNPWKKAISPYLLENQNLRNLIKVKAVDSAGNETIVEVFNESYIRQLEFYKKITYFGVIIFIIILIIIYNKKIKPAKKKLS